MQWLISRSDRISEIVCDIAQIFFASVFVGPLVSGDNSFSIPIIGLFLSLIFWTLALSIPKSKLSLWILFYNFIRLELCWQSRLLWQSLPQRSEASTCLNMNNFIQTIFIFFGFVGVWHTFVLIIYNFNKKEEYKIDVKYELAGIFVLFLIASLYAFFGKL